MNAKISSTTPVTSKEQNVSTHRDLTTARAFLDFLEMVSIVKVIFDCLGK